MASIPRFVSPLPHRLIFGSGTINELGEQARAFGDKALLVIGSQSLRSSGNLGRIENSLCEAEVSWELLEGVPAEPTLEWVDKGRELMATSDAQLVIGVGGGSVIDVAKAIGALAHEEGPTAEYHSGQRKITQRGAPIIAAPTTAGTGAEVTPNSVLTDPQRHVKASLRGGDLLPAVAIVDPKLTISCPPWQTAYSGLDAIVQALESYTSRGSNPYSDALALRAIELLAGAIRTAVRDGENLQARERMALGSTMAGMALACARLGLVHGLAHPLGHMYSLPHGMVCGLLMPAVMEFNLPVAQDKYAVAARAIGAAPADAPDEDAARALVEWMRELAGELGVLKSLDGYGLQKEDYGRIIEQTLASGSTKHNPRQVTAEDVRELLDKLYQGV